MNAVFLHIGGDVIINLRDMVAILDARILESGETTAEFLGYMRSMGRMEDLSGGQAKSYVICTKKVFLSPVSIGALRRRMDVPNDVE